MEEKIFEAGIRMELDFNINSSSILAACSMGRHGLTTKNCEDFEKIFHKFYCQALLERDEVNFYEDYYNSSLNIALYTVVCAFLVILWPLRHWASKVSLDNARLDLLLHRHVYLFFFTIFH